MALQDIVDIDHEDVNPFIQEFAKLHDNLKWKIEKIKKIKELGEITRLYNENFEKLMASVGTQDYGYFLDIEHKLNNKALGIRKRNHII